MDYTEYRYYKHEEDYDHIVGARGTVMPFTYRNEDEEDFISFHEIEFWGNQPREDRDYVEIICEMRGDETDAKVWFAIYVDGDTDNYYEQCSVLVDIPDECYWEFYSKDFGEEPEDEYHMFWLYYEDEWYWDVYYDETPPSHYDRFGGAAELAVLDLPDDDYRVNTYDIVMDGLMVEVDEEDYEWQDSDYIQDALDYWRSFTADNVLCARYLDSTGLYFSCSSWD